MLLRVKRRSCSRLTPWGGAGHSEKAALTKLVRQSANDIALTLGSGAGSPEGGRPAKVVPAKGYTATGQAATRDSNDRDGIPCNTSARLPAGVLWSECKSGIPVYWFSETAGDRVTPRVRRRV